ADPVVDALRRLGTETSGRRATSKRLDAIPGVGPALATALVASVADPKGLPVGTGFLGLCANRPNTWLPRPLLQSEDSPCQPGAAHNKHSRRCSRSRDMPLRRLAIACGQHRDTAGHGRKSRYGMAPAIRS